MSNHEQDLQELEEKYGWRPERPATAVNPRTLAIIAARKRGWSLDQIGFACGVSRERIRQILEREGEDAKVELKRRRHSMVRVQLFCKQCNKPFWKGRWKTVYCSPSCRTAATRSTTFDALFFVIEQRLAGKSWTDACREAGILYQTASRAIFCLLHRYGYLLTPILRRIYSETMIGYETRNTGFQPRNEWFVSDGWLARLKQYVAEDGGEAAPMLHGIRRDYVCADRSVPPSAVDKPSGAVPRRRGRAPKAPGVASFPYRTRVDIDLKALYEAFETGVPTLRISTRLGCSRNVIQRLRDSWRKAGGIGPIIKRGHHGHDGYLRTPTLTPEEARARKNARAREWKAANRDKMNAYNRKYAAANREKIRAQARAKRAMITG